MRTEEIWQILRNGGLNAEPSADEADAGVRLVGRFDCLTDPSGVDALGVTLAARARELQPRRRHRRRGREGPDRRLHRRARAQVPVWCAASTSKVSSVRRATSPEGTRAIFVADKIRKSGFVYAVRNFVEREGGELVARRLVRDGRLARARSPGSGS